MVKKFTQSLNVAHSTTFVGKGKLIEIEYFVKENEIDLVIFDDDLTPSQLRNIEKQLCSGVYNDTLQSSLGCVTMKAFVCFLMIFLSILF